VADGEIIVMEMTIVIESGQPNTYFFKPQMEKRQRLYNVKTMPEGYANVPDEERMKMGLADFFTSKS
jgi:hypothetical protein